MIEGSDGTPNPEIVYPAPVRAGCFPTLEESHHTPHHAPPGSFVPAPTSQGCRGQPQGAQQTPSATDQAGPLPYQPLDQCVRRRQSGSRWGLDKPCGYVLQPRGPVASLLRDSSAPDGQLPDGAYSERSGVKL